MATFALLCRETIPSRRAVIKPLSQGPTHRRHVIRVGGMMYMNYWPVLSLAVWKQKDEFSTWAQGQASGMRKSKKIHTDCYTQGTAGSALCVLTHLCTNSSNPRDLTGRNDHQLHYTDKGTEAQSDLPKLPKLVSRWHMVQAQAAGSWAQALPHLAVLPFRSQMKTPCSVSHTHPVDKVRYTVLGKTGRIKVSDVRP